MTQRFWVPTGQAARVDSNGFLIDPDEDGGILGHRTINTLAADDLRAHRAVALLGEPGMGKSTFLRDNRPLLSDGCEAVTVHHDLAEFGSEDRLVRTVFESDAVTSRLASNDELCLVLDGFDDAQTRIPQLGVLVVAGHEVGVGG